MSKKSVGLGYFNNKFKELNETKKFYLDEEKDEFIIYNVKFSFEKIALTIEELINTSLYCNDNNLEELKGEKLLMYLDFLIFKNFTDADKLLKDKDFEYKLKFAKNIRDTGLVSLFIDNVFDSIEVNKVYDAFYEAEEKAKKLLPQIEKYEREKAKLPKLNK